MNRGHFRCSNMLKTSTRRYWWKKTYIKKTTTAMSQQGTTHPSPLIIESMATAMWENVTGPLFENGLRPKGSTWDCVRCQTRSKLTATNTQHPVHFYFVEAKGGGWNIWIWRRSKFASWLRVEFTATTNSKDLCVAEPLKQLQTSKLNYVFHTSYTVHIQHWQAMSFPFSCFSEKERAVVLLHQNYVKI